MRQRYLYPEVCVECSQKNKISEWKCGGSSPPNLPLGSILPANPEGLGLEFVGIELLGIEL
jgi:hypothetical protein